MMRLGVLLLVALAPTAQPAIAGTPHSFFARDRAGNIVRVTGLSTEPVSASSRAYSTVGALSSVETGADDAIPTSFTVTASGRREIENLDLDAAGMTQAQQKQLGKWLLSNGGRMVRVLGHRVGNGQVAVPDTIALVQ